MSDAEDRITGPELHLRLREAKLAGDAETLLAALDHPTEARFAVRYLADLGANEAVPRLQGLVASRDPQIRADVASALARLHSVRDLPVLKRMAAKDPVPWVRAAALESIAELAPLAVSRSIIHSALSDAHWQPRIAAVSVLRDRGEQTDITALKAGARAVGFWERRRFTAAVRAISRRTKMED